MEVNNNMQEDLVDRGMAKGVDTITRRTLPKKVSLKECQNYHTISLSKIML